MTTPEYPGDDEFLKDAREAYANAEKAYARISEVPASEQERADALVQELVTRMYGPPRDLDAITNPTEYEKASGLNELLNEVREDLYVTLLTWHRDASDARAETDTTSAFMRVLIEGGVEDPSAPKDVE